MASIPASLPNTTAEALPTGESVENAEDAAKINQAMDMVVMAVIQNMVQPMFQDIRKTIGGA